MIVKNELPPAIKPLKKLNNDRNEQTSSSNEKPSY